MKKSEQQNILIFFIIFFSAIFLVIESGFFMILFNVILPWIFNVSWHLTFWKAFVLSIFINLLTYILK